MRVGFSTNSIGETDVLQSLCLLHEMGYQSMAITLDRHVLSPSGDNVVTDVSAWKSALESRGMTCVIETGARYLLNARMKHEPTLVSSTAEGRHKRISFLKHAIDMAAHLNARCVSLWSGVVHDAAPERELWRRLLDGMAEVLDYAAGKNIRIAFEPEPGMFIDTVSRFETLIERLGDRYEVHLTIDVGHLVCMGECPMNEVLKPWQDRIINVHIDDMLACRHEHIPLGKGEVDFDSFFNFLFNSEYQEGLYVELPRQSHYWFESASGSLAFLQRHISRRTKE
ncbi:MAG: sugar phosphate isomerase/epimerase family protein [Pirellulales bacterium]